MNHTSIGAFVKVVVVLLSGTLIYGQQAPTADERTSGYRRRQETQRRSSVSVWPTPSGKTSLRMRQKPCAGFV